MKRLADQTLYEILEVAPEATAAAIEAAYERVRSLYAPGSLATYALMSSEEADLLARRIEDARTTLLDAASRARYDESLSHGAGAAPGGESGPRAAAPSLPPVIPAAKPPPSIAPEAGPNERGAPPEHGPSIEPARPAALLAGAAGTAGPPADGPRRPILLEREVGAEVSPPRPVASRAPRAPEPPIPEVTEWTGEALRLAREARGITVQQVADRTKVTRYHIENIEGERFGALPAPVYLRGILLSIARELRLDGQRVARSYLERVAGSMPAAPPPKR